MMTTTSLLHFQPRPRSSATPALATFSTPALRVTLVAPDAVPPGATVLGVLIAADDAASASAPAPAAQIVEPGLQVDRVGRRVTVDGREVPLTRREFDLLDHLVTHPGRVHTRSQLLSSVWDFTDPTFTAPRTVDVHVARLRRKLGSQHSAALETLRGVGYRWTRPTPAVLAYG